MTLTIDNFQWFADGEIAANCVVNLEFRGNFRKDSREGVALDDVELISVDVVEIREIGTQQLTSSEKSQLPRQFRDEYDRSECWRDMFRDRLQEQAMDRFFELV